MRVKLLKLAKLLHTFEMITTDKGNLISENEVIVGTEVFIENAEGELEPAPSGEYISKDNVYIVESGKVIEIKILNVEEPIETTETIEEPIEQTEEFTEVEEVVETIETPTVEEVVEVAEEVVDEKEKIIEELKAEIERLKAENEELKKQLEQPIEDAIEEQTTVYSKQDKVKRTSLEAIAESLK
jgi:vacuolar-type H+-ATPase subunit I/STV1